MIINCGALLTGAALTLRSTDGALLTALYRRALYWRPPVLIAVHNYKIIPIRRYERNRWKICKAFWSSGRWCFRKLWRSRAQRNDKLTNKKLNIFPPPPSRIKLGWCVHMITLTDSLAESVNATVWCPSISLLQSRRACTQGVMTSQNSIVTIRSPFCGYDMT